MAVDYLESMSMSDAVFRKLPGSKEYELVTQLRHPQTGNPTQDRATYSILQPCNLLSGRTSIRGDELEQRIGPQIGGKLFVTSIGDPQHMIFNLYSKKGGQ